MQDSNFQNLAKSSIPLGTVLCTFSDTVSYLRSPLSRTRTVTCSLLADLSKGRCILHLWPPCWPPLRMIWPLAGGMRWTLGQTFLRARLTVFNPLSQWCQPTGSRGVDSIYAAYTCFSRLRDGGL